MIGVATIHAELSDVSRFPASRAYADFAPKTKQSSESESHSGMIRGNKYLRRVLYLVARGLEPFNEFYEGLVARGKSATKATRALGGKLACICCHVIKGGVHKGVLP